MPGLSSYISGRLDIPAQVASVFDQTAIQTGSVAQQFIDEHGPVLAVCTGLALKELIPETTSKAVA